MSMNTTFKTWELLMEFLKTIDYPQCFTVNYLPDTSEYELWIGNQPYYVYEKWIEELENEIKELKSKNKKLIDFIEGNEFDLTPEFRRCFHNGIK